MRASFSTCSDLSKNEAIRNNRATEQRNTSAEVGNIGSDGKEIRLRGAVGKDGVKADRTKGEWQTRGQEDDTDLFITNIRYELNRYENELNRYEDGLNKAEADLDNEKTRRTNSKSNEKSVIDNKAASRPRPNGKKKYSSYEKLKDMKRKSDQSDEYQDSELSL